MFTERQAAGPQVMKSVGRMIPTYLRREGGHIASSAEGTSLAEGSADRVGSCGMDVETYGDTAHRSGRFIKKRARVIYLALFWPEEPGSTPSGARGWAVHTVQEDGHWRTLHARSHPDPMNP